MSELESAVLFTPGKSSYVTTKSNGSFRLNLTEASINRGNLARDTFDASVHTSALFAGGYPAVADWPKEHIPQPGHREADLMALPLWQKLSEENWTDEEIAQYIHIQNESSDSIGDVAISIQRGFLDPNDFHEENTVHGIDLNTGRLHGIRFRMILTAALDIDPNLINRLPTQDSYGMPATEFQAKEFSLVARAKEAMGVMLTYQALREVKPGDLDSLMDAREKLNRTITKLAKLF